MILLATSELAVWVSATTTGQSTAILVNALDHVKTVWNWDYIRRFLMILLTTIMVDNFLSYFFALGSMALVGNRLTLASEEN